MSVVRATVAASCVVVGVAMCSSPSPDLRRLCDMMGGASSIPRVVSMLITARLMACDKKLWMITDSHGFCNVVAAELRILL